MRMFAAWLSMSLHCEANRKVPMYSYPLFETIRRNPLSLCEHSYRRSPAPKRPAVKTATRLPTTPSTEGTSPAATLAELELDELPDEDVELESDDAVVVPFVRELLELTRAVKLVSLLKAAVTPVAFLQSEVCVPEPVTKLTVAH